MSINNTPSNKPLAPEDLQELQTVTPAIPQNLTELAKSEPAAPANLVEKTILSPANPTTMTKVAKAEPAAPSNLTEKAALAPVNPTSIPRVTKLEPVAPVNLTELAVAPALAPANLAELSAASPLAPSSLTAIAKAAMARVLIPQFQFNFQDQTYEIFGEPVDLLSVAVYSRASSATYINRYIDERGKAAYVLDTDVVGSVTNAQAYSDDFMHSSWTVAGAGKELTNEVSPTGRKAAKLIATADNSSPYMVSSIASFSIGVAVHLSLYVKGDGKSDIRISASGTATGIYFDLKNGAVLGASGGEAYIQYVGNGWYRIGARIVPAATGGFYVQLCRGTAANTSKLGDYVLISGAQATASDKILPYIETNSAAVAKTFTAKPRIEWSPATGECLGVLLEGSATNLMLNSEALENWVWSGGNILANVEMAPDNTYSARKLQANATGTSYPEIRRTVTGINVTNEVTVSFFVKPFETRYVQIAFGTGGVANDPRCNFDALTGAVVVKDADITQAYSMYMGEGWWRCCVTVVAAATSLSPIIALIAAGTESRGQMSAQTIGFGLYVWGVQLEVQRVASSYLRTLAATVSRTVEGLHMVVNTKTEFSAFVDVDYNGGNLVYLNNRIAFNLSDNSTNNYWVIYNNSGRGIGSYAIQNGAAVGFANEGVILPAGVNSYKCVMSVKPYQFRYWAEKELKPFVVTNQNYQSRESVFSFGSRYVSSVGNLFGHIRRAAFYDVALEQAEVDSL